MKQFFLLLTISFLIGNSIWAQEEEKPLLLNNSWVIHSGLLKLNDSYLSPLKYSGFVVEMESSHSSFYKNHIDKLSWINRNSFILGETSNPTQTAKINCLKGSFGFGTRYHLRPANNLSFTIGGFTDVAIGSKLNNRNVNNPASVDFAWTIYATASIRYNWIINRFMMGIQYDLQTPLLGIMFVPEMGSTYYEMLETGNFKNTFHFSSLHNKAGVRGVLNLDFILKKSILRLGFLHSYDKWTGNNLRFKEEKYSFSIGTVIDLALFSGKKARNLHPVWQ